MALLSVRGLSKSFGGVHALEEIDFDIEEGEIRGLIGPNGSGKSTFFNTVSGIYRPESGTISFDGKRIEKMEQHEIARLGMARTFQLLRVFAEMTVLDNVLVGAHIRVPNGPVADMFGLPGVRQSDLRMRAGAEELLAFLGLADFAGLPASELSGGQRRLLALGRAMAMQPKLLLLDEPAAGLSPVNVDSLMKVVLALKEKHGLTIIIVEHILKVVMETCGRVTVLDHGRKISEGKPEEVQADHGVIEAYLGEEMDDEQVRAKLDS